MSHWDKEPLSLACYNSGILISSGCDMKFFKREKNLKDEIKFDPETQYAVIRSSICTGEKTAGFKNKKDGHFVEVMVIRTSEDERRFKEIYGLDSVRTEY